MLEGINIGGEFRLKYINNLLKKQEDNLEKLNKINNRQMQKYNNQNKNLDINELTSNDKEKGKNLDMSPTNSKLIQKKFTPTSINSIKKKENSSRGELKGLENSFIGTKSPKYAETKLKSKSILEEDRLNTSTNDINNNEVTDIKNFDLEEEYIDSKKNYEKKYDTDGIMLEKELNFYDFAYTLSF